MIWEPKTSFRSNATCKAACQDGSSPFPTKSGGNGKTYNNTTTAQIAMSARRANPFGDRSAGERCERMDRSFAKSVAIEYGEALIVMYVLPKTCSVDNGDAKNAE